MGHSYEFTPACAKDLYKLRKNYDLLHSITVEHVPAILKDPYEAGEKKKGNLADVRARNIKVRNVAYRLIYRIEDDVILFVALGPHDAAYTRASRR